MHVSARHAPSNALRGLLTLYFLLLAAFSLTLNACAFDSASVAPSLASAPADEEELAASASALTLGVGSATLSLRNATPPGTQVTVAGRGFQPGDELRFTLDDVPVGDGIADAEGDVRTSLTVSADTLPGVYDLRAEAAPSGASGSARFAVRTDFGQAGFSASRTGFNPYENLLTAGNAAQITFKWRSVNFAPFMRGHVTVAATRLFAVADQGYRETTPDRDVIVHRTVGAFNKGNRFSRGSQELLWYGALGPADNGGQGPTSVSAAYGSLYAAAEDGLRVFPQDCRSDGDRCTRFWTGHTGGLVSAPTVYRNVVYVQGGGRLYAFPAQCETSTCEPLWTAESGGPWQSAAAVYKRQVYVLGVPPGRASVTLSVYPANCRSDGGDCPPLWQTDVPGWTYQGYPVLAHDRIFLTSGSALTVYPYDCGESGAPCAPLWKASGEYFNRPPAVADGVVYANGAQQQLFPGDVFGGAAWTVDCRSDGGECFPLWRAPDSFSFFGAPTVTNHLVISSNIYDVHCATDGSLCPVLREFYGVSPNSYDATATVSDGTIYIPALDRKIYAFGLPN